MHTTYFIFVPEIGWLQKCENVFWAINNWMMESVEHCEGYKAMIVETDLSDTYPSS